MPEEVGEMPFPDYLTLDRHWGRFPPEHVSLRAVLAALGAGAPSARGRVAASANGRPPSQVMAEVARAMGRAG
jgi:hypothetical protein